MASEPPGTNNPWRYLGVALGMGFIFLGAVVVGAMVGYYLDTKLGTGPWLTLVFLALGFVAGIRELLRELGKFNQK